MSDHIDPRDFGRLEAEVAALNKSVEAMAADLKAVRSALDAAGGGWRVLVAVGAASATLMLAGIAIVVLPYLVSEYRNVARHG